MMLGLGLPAYTYMPSLKSRSNKTNVQNERYNSDPAKILVIETCTREKLWKESQFQNN